MLNTNEIPTETPQEKSVEQTEIKRRKPYRKPFVEELGDLRTVTLGGSPGAGDSGGIAPQNWPV